MIDPDTYLRSDEAIDLALVERRAFESVANASTAEEAAWIALETTRVEHWRVWHGSLFAAAINRIVELGVAER